MRIASSLTIAAVAGTFALAAWADEGPAQCSLDREAKAAVMHQWKAFLREHPVTGSEATATIRVANKGPESVRALEKLIEGEKSCCSHLDFKLEQTGQPGQAGGELVLTVSGPVDEVMAAAKIARR